MGCGGSKETVAAETTKTCLRKPDDRKDQISEEFSTTFPETIYKAQVHKQDIHVQEETKKPVPVAEVMDLKKEMKEMKKEVSADEKGQQEAEVDEKEEDENTVISGSTETTTMARVVETKLEAKIEEARSLVAESNQVAH